jgi:predicted aminopeptidase
MLAYPEHELVNTLIHETVHATLYIKSSADFNERMAVFLGNKGMELFYHQREGKDSKTLAIAQKENEDDKLFSQFISKEIQSLDAWYKSNPEKNEDARLAKIAEIQKHFIKELQAKLKSKSYDRFPEIKLNNARLLMYKTYMQDLSDFETLYKLSNEDFQIFLDHCKSLESAEKPEEGLKALIARLQGK